jgi:hypothetical protein
VFVSQRTDDNIEYEPLAITRIFSSTHLWNVRRPTNNGVYRPSAECSPTSGLSGRLFACRQTVLAHQGRGVQAYRSAQEANRQKGAR